MRKKTNDNSVKYVPSVIGSPEENSHDHKSKTVSNPRKRNKKFSQNNENCFKKITRIGFRKIELTAICYF